MRAAGQDARWRTSESGAGDVHSELARAAAIIPGEGFTTNLLGHGREFLRARRPILTYARQQSAREKALYHPLALRRFYKPEP